jgi:glutamyl-Q tRNA(Asp) synthetase
MCLFLRGLRSVASSLASSLQPPASSVRMTDTLPTVSLPVTSSATIGRFAPSPTGPLHLGSLVGAVGSWLFARSGGGRWLVRMEDLDTPRVVPGAAEEILETLRRYGLEWDGDVVVQSQRVKLYHEVLRKLEATDRVFECGCTRAELKRYGIRRKETEDGDGAVYPGFCRDGLPPGKRARLIRFRAPATTITFDDRVRGVIRENLATATGDFVLLRADGIVAYQLAVVVDDAEAGVTEVVRGADLLSSTARQIALQRALGYATPSYAHLPLVVDAGGRKLGKKYGSLPLSVLDGATIRRTLRLALEVLGIPDAEGETPEQILGSALASFDERSVPEGEFIGE